jgi:thymidylate synthase ThyX
MSPVMSKTLSQTRNTISIVTCAPVIEQRRLARWNGSSHALPCCGAVLPIHVIFWSETLDNGYNPAMYFTEEFTDAERAILGRFFTNTDRPVFALVNLPEVVKGALFARYSRTPKSLRRLFLDEFYNQPEMGVATIADAMDGDDSALQLERAEKLYERVFSGYGDDSVAQLGGAHLACEQASNLLTKVLERGRLAAYLEQSTRYIYYDQKLGANYRYLVPPEVKGSPLEAEYVSEMDRLFETYSAVVQVCKTYYEEKFPRQPGDSLGVWRSSIRAKSCDAARGLLPASTTSNLGIFATGQSYEMMLLRMRAHPLAEAREYADIMLAELRHVIPSFVKRVDVPDRGGVWSDYFANIRSEMEDITGRMQDDPDDVPEVQLTEWDPDAEAKLAAAALYEFSDLPDSQLSRIAAAMSVTERERVLKAYIGNRSNRRHHPGRGFERSFYRFDILSDFGSFRDLQRHRMLSIDWQRLSPTFGYNVPGAVEENGLADQWNESMSRMTALHGKLSDAFGPDAAQYAVPFAFKLRYYMQMNAREAFHLLELRTAQQGHADYRRICQEMHRLIAEQAGHRVIAGGMNYVDHNDYGETGLERLEAERRSEQRRRDAGLSGESGE